MGKVTSSVTRAVTDTPVNKHSLSRRSFLALAGAAAASAGLAAARLPAAFASEAQELGPGTVESSFSCAYGTCGVTLEAGFGFLDSGSENPPNWGLALTAVTLACKANDADAASALLHDLGYDHAEGTLDGSAGFKHPVSVLAYKRLGEGRNLFAVSVRGTYEDADKWTDAFDGFVTMFSESAANVLADLDAFVQGCTGRALGSFEGEENYFLLTGHSLGGATANALSADETVLKLAGGDKGRVYTYTFESPHTCQAGLSAWQRSNAYNLKDNDDFFTHVPAHIKATTWGHDLTFTVGELDNSIFTTLFPDAKGGSVTEAPKVSNFDGAVGGLGGHHDLGLDLVYILQRGIAEGRWAELGEAARHDTSGASGDGDGAADGALADWSAAFEGFVLGGGYRGSLQDYDFENDSLDAALGEARIEFALHDMDGDGIPELVALNGVNFRTMWYAYGCDGGQVVYRGGDRLWEAPCRAEGSSGYPGLFVRRISYKGMNRTFYFTIEGGKVVWTLVEGEAIEGYEGWLEERYGISGPLRTDDEGLYAAAQGAVPLDFVPLADIQAMGWDSFVESQGL